MKLRHQLAILLGVPLICQLLFAQVLTANLGQLDKAAAEEVRAKQIIESCQEIKSLLSQYFLRVGLRQIPQSLKRLEPQADKTHDRVSLCLARLQQLTAVDGADKAIQETVQHYVMTVKRAERYATDILNAFAIDQHQPSFAEFLSEAESLQDLSFALQEVFVDEDRIVARYGPLQKSFQPQALSERERLRNWITIFAVSDTILVLGLAIFFGKHTLKRLRSLIDNIGQFSKGNTALVPISGDDELSEIDKEFRVMAKARVEAEETRKSMYQLIQHDLRTPLTSIGLTLQYIQAAEQESMPASISEKLSSVTAESSRLSRLVSSFLDLEALDAGTLKLHRQDIEASDLIEETVESMHALARSKGIRIDSSAENCVIYADSDRLIQVLVNLLSNAIKHSKKNTRVRLVGTADQFAYKICVYNQGQLISEEAQRTLFQRFARLEGTTSHGTGLGLYICKTLVQAHGGSIGFSNDTPGELCFWFSVPISNDADSC